MRTGPLAPIACLVAGRTVAWEMAKREVLSRYRGSSFGVIWAFLTPLLLLGIYGFVFGAVFQARWDRPVESPAEFGLVLFAGLLVYNVFAECVSRAPSLVRSYANYVKRIVFPLELLPWIAVTGALFHAAIGMLALIAAEWAILGTPPATALLLPLVLAPLVLLTLGLAWTLAALGVYVPDAGQIVAVGLTGALFLSTIFFPASAAPEVIAPYLYLNPLSFIVDQTRAVLLWGDAPDWRGLACYAAGGWAVAWGGLWLFERTRKGFADVI